MRRSTWLYALACALAGSPAAAGTFSVAPNVSSGNPATYTWTVSADGGAGQSNPTLILLVGQTYTFTANTTAIHPFWIKTSPVIGSGSAYPTGGASGLDANGATSASTPMTFTPPASAAGTLFYICGNHSAMQGEIDVIIDPIFANGFE